MSNLARIFALSSRCLALGAAFWPSVFVLAGDPAILIGLSKEGKLVVKSVDQDQPQEVQGLRGILVAAPQEAPQRLLWWDQGTATPLHGGPEGAPGLGGLQANTRSTGGPAGAQEMQMLAMT